jgi:hypothetical protein
MEFRSPTVAAQQNAAVIAYLTKSLRDPAAGRAVVEELIAELGSATHSYPDWHPILTSPPRASPDHVSSLEQIPAYRGLDHTREFVRGFVTCPYSDQNADELVRTVNAIPDLEARRLSVTFIRTRPILSWSAPGLSNSKPTARSVAGTP